MATSLFVIDDQNNRKNWGSIMLFKSQNYVLGTFLFGFERIISTLEDLHFQFSVEKFIHIAALKKIIFP